MTKYYIATDDQGITHTRSTVSRTYTHCVIVTFDADEEEREVKTPGCYPYKIRAHKAGEVCGDTWCGRPDLAQKEVRSRTTSDAWNGARTARAYPAVEVTRQEYDAARK